MTRSSGTTILTHTVAIILFAVWLVGQTFHDHWWPTALCFYVPSPLVAAILAAIALLALWKRRSRTACLAGLLAAGPALFVGCVENRWLASQNGADSRHDLRVVHWNVFGGNWGWHRVCRTLKGLEADA
jgi:hypothetical protein